MSPSTSKALLHQLPSPLTSQVTEGETGDPQCAFRITSGEWFGDFDPANFLLAMSSLRRATPELQEGRD